MIREHTSEKIMNRCMQIEHPINQEHSVRQVSTKHDYRIYYLCKAHYPINQQHSLWQVSMKHDFNIYYCAFVRHTIL